MVAKLMVVGITTVAILFASADKKAKESMAAERGSQFYEFEDVNSSDKKHAEGTDYTASSPSNESRTEDISKILKELLGVAKEQRDIQQKILEALNEEFNPTPKKIVINGKECIANSSADCFVMPLTKDAKKNPVIKDLIVNPNVDTAKAYLQWQAKLLSSAFKVGRSFEYAMNTYGNEAYPMNLSRPDVNSNDGVLLKKRSKQREILLSNMYKDKTLALYIFLQASSLDYFSAKEISEIARNINQKDSLTLVFRSEQDKNSFFEVVESEEMIKNGFKGVSTIINKDSFTSNNIYMTPTYTVAYKKNKDLKKQAIAIGRVSKDSLNEKIYEWLEQESIVKRGALSDYKIWDVERIEKNADK